MPPSSQSQDVPAFSQSQLEFAQPVSQDLSQDSQASDASIYTSPSPALTRASSPSETLSELDSDMFTENNDIAETTSTPAGLLQPSTSLKVKRKRTSWVYNHMHATNDMQAVFFNAEQREIWPCRYCGEKGVIKQFIIAGGSKKIEYHLLKEHNISATSPARQRALDQQPSIKESMASAALNNSKRRRLAETVPEDRELDGATIESLYVKFIANDNQSLRLVTCPEFRAFLRYLNPNVNVYLPNSASTVTEWVLRQFVQEKERVRSRIQSVVGHYINEDNVLEHVVLGMKEVIGVHDGENISKVVMKVLVDWGIISKLGWFQMDNAANNDTMLRSISRILRDVHDLKYDVKLHRVRCQGHIINLAVHSFLFVTDTEAIEADNMDAYEVREQLRLTEEWRKMGPLGRLHNIIIHIQSSPQRMQNFLRISKGRRPARDNKTRWNSWEKAIKVAVNAPVHEAIKTYFDDYVYEDCELDALSDNDWEILREIHAFLAPLAQATNALQSNNNTLDIVLPAMDFILNKFESGKVQHAAHPHLSSMFNSGWSKMEKYYKMTDDTPVYVAALILNPRRKWAYIRKNWDASWTPRAEELMLGLWESYKPKVVGIPQPRIPSIVTDNQFLLYMDEQDDVDEVLDDEYAHYCAQPIIKTRDAREWWLDDVQQRLYPNLSKLALDILSIPAMAAEPERLFSDTKMYITDL